jgi:HAMP domain-containing protein
MLDLIVHQTNISHYRLIELSKLADQAKPFYDWVERTAKRTISSHKELNEILLNSSKSELRLIIENCYKDLSDSKPFLFDGVWRTYTHSKACFYFFAWIVRDAPQQRLAPLISRMQKADSITKMTAEIDSLIELIYEYKSVVKSFEWQAVREIIIDRLEWSRRSIRGHVLESSARTGLVTAIQNYYSIYGNYGKFKKIEIADKQIKIWRHTVDVSAVLYPNDSSMSPCRILIPIKTRETEGGGHSHIFTRDIISAITDIKLEWRDDSIAVVIVAENWSPIEIKTIDDSIDIIFHFNMSPNKFEGFDEDSQIMLNQHIAKLLT